MPAPEGLALGTRRTLPTPRPHPRLAKLRGPCSSGATAHKALLLAAAGVSSSTTAERHRVLNSVEVAQVHLVVDVAEAASEPLGLPPWAWRAASTPTAASAPLWTAMRAAGGRAAAGGGGGGGAARAVGGAAGGAQA
jgi:hypothetical protein